MKTLRMIYSESTPQPYRPQIGRNLIQQCEGGSSCC